LARFDADTRDMLAFLRRCEPRQSTNGLINAAVKHLFYAVRDRNEPAPSLLRKVHALLAKTESVGCTADESQAAREKAIALIDRELTRESAPPPSDLALTRRHAPNRDLPRCTRTRQFRPRRWRPDLSEEDCLFMFGKSYGGTERGRH
jgi:Protein of unknown function (DUF2786)